MKYFTVDNIPFRAWLKNGQAIVQRNDREFIPMNERLGLKMVVGTFFEFRDIVFLH